MGQVPQPLWSLILGVDGNVRTVDLSGRNLGDEMECAWKAWPRVMSNDIGIGGGCCDLQSGLLWDWDFWLLHSAGAVLARM